MQNPEEIIRQTQKWIMDVVIGCQFCPFAAREVKRVLEVAGLAQGVLGVRVKLDGSTSPSDDELER